MPAGVAVEGASPNEPVKTETVRDIRADYGYGWHVDDVSTIYKAPKGLARAARRHLRPQVGARLDAEVPPPVARLLPRAADAGLGRRPLRHRLRQHPLLLEADREAGGMVGRTSAEILDTWDKLGIPEAEKKYLAGVGAQYESEVVYHKLQADLEARGDLPRHGLGPARARGAREAVLRDDHPAERQQVRRAELGRLVGRLVHLRPAGRLDRDAAQAYFRINAENMGQFERTLIIVDEGAYVHYVEGCTAPIYSSDSLHSAVVEIVVKKGGRCRYDDPELVEQRLQPRHEARSRLRRRDDGVGRREPRLEGDDEVPRDLADGRAGARRGALDRVRRQGAAPGRGRQGRPRREEHVERDHVEVDLEERRARRLPRPARGREGRDRLEVEVVCDALILDEESRSDTYPYIDVKENDVDLGHEATVSKIGEEQLFYLMSRGLSEAEASAMIVAGFVEPITKGKLPLEYAVEMNRLIQLQMEGSVG